MNDSEPELLSALARVPLFAGLDRALLQELDRECHRLTLAGGSELFHQGDAAEALYVVLSGRLEVVSEPEPGRRVLLDELARGACVGEMSLLTGERRSATVRAIRDSEVLAVDSARFARFLATHPQVGAELARTLARRLQETTAAVSGTGKERIATIAIVPALAEDLPPDFVPTLLECFARRGLTVRRLDRAAVDAHLGPGSSRADAWSAQANTLVRWLCEQEEETQYLLYEGDAAHDGWTQLCLRQADRILLVARAEADPSQATPWLWKAAAEATGTGARRDVVLLHPGEASPRHSARWRRDPAVGALHHVRLLRRSDHERLIRTVTGEAVRLVLSGGSSRRLRPHRRAEGAPRARHPGGRGGGHEHGLHRGRADRPRVDAGGDGRAQPRGLRDHGRDPRRARRHPARGLPAELEAHRAYAARHVRGARHRRRVDAVLLRVRQPEPRPGRGPRHGPALVLGEGELRRARHPGPTFHDGDIHVDGGLLNNLPADIMRARGSGPIIAIDVNPPVEFPAPPGENSVLSGHEVLFRRLLGGNGPRLPSIFGLLSRSVGLASLNDRKRMSEFADLSLYPPMQEIEPFDWTAVADAAERGYRYALPRIAAWQEARKRGVEA